MGQEKPSREEPKPNLATCPYCAEDIRNLARTCRQDLEAASKERDQKMPFMLVVVIGTAIWVGLDASQRDWSNNKFAKSPAVWVLGCLLLWIVAFPVYLAQRSSVPLKTGEGARAVPMGSSASAPSDRVWLASGQRYLLGYTIANPLYCIWDRGDLKAPFHRFPYGEHGKTEAWDSFNQLEPGAELVAPLNMPPPP
jgi:hypothetical protein